MSITTRLTTSGNSKAVRLPKQLLLLAALGEEVELEAKRGQIIIRNPKSPRASWPNQIEKVLAHEAHLKDDDFADMDTASTDGLDDLPWDGPTYEQWLKRSAKK